MDALYSFDYDVFDIRKNDSGKYTKTYVKTDSYSFRSFFDHPLLLIIEKNGIKHYFKVVPDSAWAYSVQKTQIRASGGAAGLARLFADPEWRDHMVNLINKILNHVKECM